MTRDSPIQTYPQPVNTVKVRLGDFEVNRIGLGTNRLHNMPARVGLVVEAVAPGVRHIDTA